MDNKKAGVMISLQKYREKKRKLQAKKKAAGNDINVSSSINENLADIIYMETYKNKRKQPYNTKEHKQSNTIKEKEKNKDKDNLIMLDDYRRKKKWKKEFLFHTAQTAAMAFLFVFMFIGISSLNKPTSKIADNAEWFQAPKNKGLVIASKINDDRRKPASSSSCGIPSDKKKEKPIKEMQRINPKDCQTMKF